MSQNVTKNDPLACETPGRDGTEWKWSKAKESAALLVAQDDINDEAIADQVGTTRRTLARWKEAAEFKARVAEHLDEIRREILRLPVCKKLERAKRINRDWQELCKIQPARQQAAYDQAALHEEVQAQLAPLIPQRDALRQSIRERDKRKARSKSKEREVDEVAEAEMEELERLNDEIYKLERRDPGPLVPGQETGEMVRIVTYTKAGEKVEWQEDTPLLQAIQKHEEQAVKETSDYVEKIDVTSKGEKLPDAGISDDIRAERIASILDRARARRAAAPDQGEAPEAG